MKKRDDRWKAAMVLIAGVAVSPLIQSDNQPWAFLLFAVYAITVTLLVVWE